MTRVDLCLYENVPYLGPLSVLMLEAIIASKGRPMSWRELSKLTGLKAPAIHWRLKKMRDWGLIKWEPKLARTITATCEFIPVEDR